MKKSNEIIAHILKPFELKVQIHRCLKKIISLMPDKYKKFIVSIYYKNGILYINVSHPALKQEIFYNKDKVFTVLKTMHNHNICRCLNVTKIITNYKYTPSPKPPKEIKFYLKKANDFEIKAKNEEIRKKFEEIRKILKSSK